MTTRRLKTRRSTPFELSVNTAAVHTKYELPLFIAIVLHSLHRWLFAAPPALNSHAAQSVGSKWGRANGLARANGVGSKFRTTIPPKRAQQVRNFAPTPFAHSPETTFLSSLRRKLFAPQLPLKESKPTDRELRRRGKFRQYCSIKSDSS
jgi:hypothetical protein